jgi:uncharacterized protein YbjT (DUF2867 family)
MNLVVGATGVVGGMITRRLLENGQEVRVLVRRDSPSSQLVQQGRRQHSFISNRDVAAFAAAAVGNPAARNEYLTIGGPEPLTWHDVVEVYERTLGRSVPVEFVALGEPVPGLPDA